MEKEFYMGIALGLIGGAVAAANSFKIRRAVKDGQDQVISAINKMSGETKGHEQQPENQQ